MGARETAAAGDRVSAAQSRRVCAQGKQEGGSGESPFIDSRCSTQAVGQIQGGEGRVEGFRRVRGCTAEAKLSEKRMEVGARQPNRGRVGVGRSCLKPHRDPLTLLTGG